jgi:solute carrier family 13 (sodium-dependent dicarboxylate transporter), member 2/3/5
MFQRLKRLQEALDIFRFFERISGKKPPLAIRNLFIFSFGAVVAIAVVFYLNINTDLPREKVFMLGIFILASWLWLTEAVPLFATAVLIIGLEVLLLGNPGNWDSLGFEVAENPGFRNFLMPLSDPVIVLFFGGFILAMATVKEGVDKALAGQLLNIFGKSPSKVLFGMMGVTAIFSMFMSNTATAAMMITLSIPILAQIPAKEPFRKSLMLAIPFAANIGGMGTPISSPPNAVAVAYLRTSGYDVSFFEWFLIALPIWVILLFVLFFLLSKIYKAPVGFAEFDVPKSPIDRRGWFVIIIFASTVLLWLTDFFHGLPPAVVALIPPIVFTTTGLISTKDLKRLDWHILLLIAGGIALGTGMQVTELDLEVLNYLPTDSPYILGILLFSTLIMSTFLSNTASANLIIPLALAISYAIDDYGAKALIIGVALMASSAMALPVSTPPNAMAYAKGELLSKDFVLTGSIVGIIGLGLVLAYFRLMSYFGIL